MTQASVSVHFTVMTYYVTIYFRKPRIPVNVYCAFKFLLELEMNSSAIEEILNKSFQIAFFFGGEHIISFGFNFALKISTSAPIF